MIIFVQFSPDERQVLTQDGAGAVKVWNVKTGELLFSFSFEGAGFRTPLFSPPSGEYIALSETTGRYNDASVVVLRRARDGVAVATAEHIGDNGNLAVPCSAAFFPDARFTARSGISLPRLRHVHPRDFRRAFSQAPFKIFRTS